jgi:hypothetical protein
MSRNAAASALFSPAGQGVRDTLTMQVQGLIDDAGSRPIKHERRSRDRFPIPYTFRLTPIDRDGNVLTDETTTVVGKDLSMRGIGFSHDHELWFDRAIISLSHRKVGNFVVEAEIIWTRSTPIGLYESGCRLVRTVDGHTVHKTNLDDPQ